MQTRVAEQLLTCFLVMALRQTRTSAHATEGVSNLRKHR